MVVLLEPFTEVDPNLLGRARVEPLPAELVEDERATRPKQLGDLRERGRKVLDVMQRTARDNRVEETWPGQSLDRRPAEDGAVGRFRIHREHVVPRGRQPPRQLTGATSHLEHPTRRRR